MPLDPEVAAHLERQKLQPPRSNLDVAGTREMMRRAASLAGSAPPLVRIEDVVLPGNLRARQYWPVLTAGLPVIVYFHGGRFISGDLESHDTVCRMLALSAGCRVLAVDYRLAPEHRYPAAAEDARTAVESAMQDGVPVGVAGDSAGANLAAGVALEHRGPALRCQLLIYPMLDPACGSHSFAEFGEGYGPGAADMRRGWSEYLPEGTGSSDPLACPLTAERVCGAAPAFVLTAEYDTLRDEGEAYARKLVESGNLVQLRRYLGTIHGFFTMQGILQVAREALNEAGAFLRQHLADGASHTSRPSGH
jgi:acetyl esterase